MRIENADKTSAADLAAMVFAFSAESTSQKKTSNHLAQAYKAMTYQETDKMFLNVFTSAFNKFSVVLVVLTFLSMSAIHAAEKSLIQIDDLYRMESAQTSIVLPENGGLVYSRRWADRDTRSIRFALWHAKPDASHPQPMETGEPDGRQPLLSPDAKWIAFLSTRPLPDGTSKVPAVPPYSDPATDLWFIRRDGSRAIPLSLHNKTYGRVFSDPFYGNFCFSPDGKRLAFVADDGRDVRTAAEIRNDVRIVREDQGEGYEGYRPAQIWIANLTERPEDAVASRIIRVTHDEFWYGDPQWTPDGKSLIVHSNRSPQQESVRYSINQNYDLWRINLEDQSLRQLTFGPGPEVSPRVSPDGKQMVYLTIPRKGSHMDAFNLAVADLEKTLPETRVLYDHHADRSARPPHLPPQFPLPRDTWLSDQNVYFNAADGTINRTQVLNINNSAIALPDAQPERFNDALARQAAIRRNLTPVADPFLNDRVIATGEVVKWKGADGWDIEGIFTRPTLPGAQAPYKMVLYPHGGPHSRSTLGFDFTVQVLAAHGYAVFQPNFRGSTGYGQKFIDADRLDLGGNDMTDMRNGISYLVSEKLVDPNRQFIYGISYGGYSTTWLIGQTDQFRAAVPQNAVTDLNAMWGLTDIQSWTEWEIGGLPWEVPELMRKRSPLTYASRVKTPTLILHAANDRRCPLPMGLLYYRALKKAGVETELIIYPNEGHPIKQLPHLEDVLTRVLDWFAKHDVPAQ